MKKSSENNRAANMHGKDMGYGFSMGTGSRERPNLFVPAKHCVHCENDTVEFSVVPTCWPVDSVARVCYACGRILRYVDNLLLFTDRRAVIEYTSRLGGVVQRGIAKSVDNEVDREKIIRYLEMGFTAGLIAADFKCEPRYVKQIARAAGLEA